MINYNKEIKGSFDQVYNDQFIMEIVANFHFRNGIKNEDGSRGEVIITTKEFNDCLAYVFFIGLDDH